MAKVKVRALARCYVNDTLHEPGAEFLMEQPKGHLFPDHVEVVERAGTSKRSAAPAEDERDDQEEQDKEEVEEETDDEEEEEEKPKKKRRRR